MSDFGGNFFLDPGITIKEEPLTDQSTYNTSASMPIPVRRVMEITNFRDYGIEIENSQSPFYHDGSLEAMQTPEEYHHSSLWGNRLVIDDNAIKTEALIHMDDDDIFQVDKADLIQGPTLAELNANDETLLGDLNFDDLLLPEEGASSYMTTQKAQFIQINNSNSVNNNVIVTASSSCPQSSLLYYRDLDSPSSLPSNNYSAFSPTISQTSSNSPLLQSSPSHNVSNVQPKHSTLQELLLKRGAYISPDRTILTQKTQGPENTPPSTSPNIRQQQQHRSHQSRLSSSAPTHLGLDQLWQRREPRQHLLSTGSLAEAGSTSSLSTGGILSPDPHDFSPDEFDSDDDSDADHQYEDVSSENESDDDHMSKQASKKERFFWQYNVQAKGPKGQRLVMKCKMEDPFILNEVTDPVFSPDCSVRGIKHSGKARKGDGNDLTPNARKLYNIGKELDRLGKTINEMTPVSELPFNIRPKSRKEKNKLASRACRLKKKAQHEANKIKLSGLEVEHKNLMNGIVDCKEMILAKLHETSVERQKELTMNLDNTFKIATRTKVAGYTTEYVNKVLDRLKKGQSTVTKIEEA